MDINLESMWTEKYRPKSVKDVLMPQSYRNAFEKYIECGVIDNIILYSDRPGTGKTSLGKALANDIGAEFKFINASLNNGIDVIRDQIQSFVDYESFDGKPKIVLLDEFDGSSIPMQRALKTFIEEYYDVCRFIVTCNSVVSIIDPLQSRCTMFNFNFSAPHIREEIAPLVVKRIAGIIKVQGSTFDEDTLLKLVYDRLPDIRSIIQACKQSVDMFGGVVPDALSISVYDDSIVNALISGDVETALDLVAAKNDYNGLYTYLYGRMKDLITSQSLADIVPVLSDHMYRSASSPIDDLINFHHMAIRIRHIVNKIVEVRGGLTNA